MEIRKTIKKIAAFATGAILVGATLTGAAAMDLNDYPGNFITDKNFDGVIVVGEQADSSDVIGAINIAMGIQRAADEDTVSFNDEIGEVAVASNNNMLELGEAVGEVLKTVTDDDLSLLGDGNIRTSKGSADYSQFLRFGNNEAEVVYGEDSNDLVGDFLKFEDEGIVFEYELKFQTGLESDVDNGVLEDFEDETINFIGKDYNIMDAELDGDEITLTLVTGKVNDILNERETKTYTVDGKDYVVEVLVISDSTQKVKLKINSDVTSSMYAGDSYKLEDGTEVYIKEVITNEGTEEGGSDMVEFYIGSGKLVLKDDDYTDTDYYEGVDLNEDSVDSAYTMITGLLNGDDFKLASIKYKLNADINDEEHLMAGSSVSNLLDNAEGLFGLDIAYEGLNIKEGSEIKLVPSGDDAYKLRFVSVDGKSYNIPLIDNSDGFKFGTDDENLIFIEGEDIAKKDYFIISDGNDEDSSVHVLRYDSINKNDEIITLSDLEGDSFEISYTGGSGELIIGGDVFDFEVDGNYNLLVDHDGDGNIASGRATIAIEGEGVIDLGDNNTIVDSVDITLTTSEDKFDTENGDEVITITISDEGDEVDASIDGVDMYSHEHDDDVSTGMSGYGVFIKEEDESGDPAELVISYPAEQVSAKVFVRADSYEEPVAAPPLSIAGAILDSEITDITAQNMILVGGPCANKVTMELMGASEDNCALGFEEGKAIIKLYENEGKVAMVVAGYSALDTRRACSVVANFEQYDLFGSEVEVLGTTLEDIEVITVK